MSDEPPSPDLPAPLARSLRMAIRLAARPETDSRIRRDVLALCEAVLLRLELRAAPALVSEADATANVREQLVRSGELAPPARAALWSELAAYAQREALRLESHERAVAAELGAADATAATLTTDAVQRYLQRRFPDQPPEVIACTEVPGGRSKVTLMLRLGATGSLPHELVLRCDRAGSAQATSVRDEFPVLRAMYEARAFAPEPLWLESDPEPLGSAFLAMRRMPGSSCGDYWSAGAAGPAHARSLAQALARIHGVEARAVWPRAPSSARESTAELVSGHETRWHEVLSAPSILLELGYAWLGQQLHVLTGASVVVHGDCHFANVLYDGERISCLTDWEFAHAGHPAEDLAFCRAYVERILPWAEFMEHYQASGGRQVSVAELGFFRVWTYLRNATLAARALPDVLAGRATDVHTVAIAVHARARLEASLAGVLAEELARARGGSATS